MQTYINLAYRIGAAFLVWCLFTPLPSSYLSAQTAITLTADRQYEFADHYFESGQYGLAAQEYRRFLYFFPDDPRVEMARYRTGLSYFKNNDFTSAVDQFQTLINEFGESELSVESCFMISRSYVKMNSPGDAINSLRNLIILSSQPAVRDRAHHAIGWIYIDAAAFGDARNAFEKISPSGRSIYNIEPVETAISDESAIPKKNPGLAAGLSILPGAGQVYCGRYKDALIAFLINGGLIWATVEAFQNENYALGTVLGVVELGFYAGNIYNAASSAHKYNQRQTRGFIENLKHNSTLGLGPAPDGSGMVLGFNFRF